MTEGLQPVIIAVVYPVDSNALRGAVEAAESGLITPVLVGPVSRMQVIAKEEELDISHFRLVDTSHSHEAAQRAVAMARNGEVEALMKGSLQTEELMLEVVANYTGLKQGKRISHVAVVDVPGHPRPLFLTDAGINIYPTLEQKRDIVQNAINLARVLGVDSPRVALLAAVETISSRLTSTLDAAALCKMADRGQITGGIVDGPLAFDDAISAAAADAKHINSRVAGEADILVVPDLESGTMLSKQLEYLAGAQAAHVVIGAMVPIVLPDRADFSLARKASCAVALMVAQHNIAEAYGREYIAAQSNRNG
jgi:phosphate acetyltransferase